MIARELESHLGAGNVAVEEFTVAPGGFLSPYPGAIFMLLAALLNMAVGRFTGISPWLTTLAALAFSVISLLLFICEFILGLELIDPLFPKKQSVNVIGTLRQPGAQNAKRLLLLSGHHDSAPESTWLRFTGYGFFFLSATYFIGLGVMLAMSLTQLAGVITGNTDIIRMGTLGWVLLAYPIAPSIVFALFANRDRKNGGTVPGAVDNLSASALAVAMCRFLARNPSYIPADTEIRFISFGSEEAGCRGSRRYVERYLDELVRLDALAAQRRDGRLSRNRHPHLGDEWDREEFARDGAKRGRWPRACRGSLQGETGLPRNRERRRSLQPRGPQGHDATSLQVAATDGRLLSSEVGQARSLNDGAAAKRAEAHFRVGTQWRGIGKAATRGA